MGKFILIMVELHLLGGEVCVCVGRESETILLLYCFAYHKCYVKPMELNPVLCFEEQGSCHLVYDTLHIQIFYGQYYLYCLGR
jgi:hypothetical protein